MQPFSTVIDINLPVSFRNQSSGLSPLTQLYTARGSQSNGMYNKNAQLYGVNL